jgi:hypothetical protein
VEELHPGVEMTHVRVGPVDERLNLRVDRAENVTRQQLVDDDRTVLHERADDLLGRRIGLDPLQTDATS